MEDLLLTMYIFKGYDNSQYFKNSHNRNVATLSSGSSNQESFIANAAGLYQQMGINGAGVCVFMKEQYDQLLQMLHKNQSSSSSNTNVNANAAGSSDLQAVRFPSSGATIECDTMLLRIPRSGFVSTVLSPVDSIVGQRRSSAKNT
ncbi:hypothetical protein HAX54_035738 [Datura stramonium]|uniref:Uncharacterized protein n=1 Tax=Datura stramonium TaxID=4076 RepID=A0ABS8SFU4_DATST|nr:hypothetical protein [Datura stramonium]